MDTKKQTPEEAPALSEAEMKAIGEISIGPSKHEVFLNNHYKKLIWGCVALGLLGGGAIAWFSYRHTTDQDAAAALVGAMNAQHALTDLNPADFNGEGLRSITESSRYGKTPSAGTARLLEGLRLIATGQQDAGIKALEPIAADSSRPELAARAHAQLASLYMQQENDEKAAAHWKAILDLGPTAYSAFACMSLGDIARAAGKGLHEQRSGAHLAGSPVRGREPGAREPPLDRLPHEASRYGSADAGVTGPRTRSGDRR